MSFFNSTDFTNFDSTSYVIIGLWIDLRTILYTDPLSVDKFTGLPEFCVTTEVVDPDTNIYVV